MIKLIIVIVHIFVVITTWLNHKLTISVVMIIITCIIDHHRSTIQTWFITLPLSDQFFHNKF